MPTPNKLYKYNIETDHLEYISDNIYKTFHINDKIEIIVYTIIDNNKTLLKYKNDVLEKVHNDALLREKSITNDEKYIYYIINENYNKTKLIRYNTVNKTKEILHEYIGHLKNIITDNNGHIASVGIFHYDMEWIVFDKKYNIHIQNIKKYCNCNNFKIVSQSTKY